MAVPTVTLTTPKPARAGNTPFGTMAGSISCSAYDTAHPAVTAIVGGFIAEPKVVAEGQTSSGYAVAWDDTTSSFKAYEPGAVTVTAGAVGSASAVASATSVTMSDTCAAPDILVTSGGTVSAMTITRGGYTGHLTSAGVIAVREVGDVFSATFTSGAAPSVEKLPRASTPTAAVAAGGVEVASGTNIGQFDFVAVGQLG